MPEGRKKTSIKGETPGQIASPSPGWLPLQHATSSPAKDLRITSFRLASTQRRFDTSTEKWIDGETNWYTVTAFRQLATHAAESGNKGDRILVVGKLRIRKWENDERTGSNIEVEAEAIGHDLTWGTGVFTRSVGATIPVESEEAAEPTAVGGTQG